MMVSNLKNGLSALFSARGLLPAIVTQIFLMIPMIRMPLFPLLQLRDLPYKYLIIYLVFFLHFSVIDIFPNSMRKLWFYYDHVNVTICTIKIQISHSWNILPLESHIGLCSIPKKNFFVINISFFDVPEMAYFFPTTTVNTLNSVGNAGISDLLYSTTMN